MPAYQRRPAVGSPSQNADLGSESRAPDAALAGLMGPGAALGLHGALGSGALGNGALGSLLTAATQGTPEDVFALGTQGSPGSLPHRDWLERSFGADLGGLDVYQSDSADAALSGLGALGASSQGDLLLPRGAPREVVAHEVAHARQEDAFGGGGLQARSMDGGKGDAAERDADAAADAAMANKPAVVSEAPTAGVHRWGVTDWIGDKVSDATDWVGDKASDAAGWVGDKASDAAGWVGEKATDAASWVGDKASDVGSWASNKWDDAKGWAGDRVNDAKDWGVEKLSQGASWLNDRYDDTYRPALDWVRNKTDGATDVLKDAVGTGGGWLSSGLDWLGWEGGADAVRDGVAWTQDKLQGVRDVFGLDEHGNSFTEFMEIPDNSKDFTQQFSELGLPLTAAAWDYQDQIDGGKLHRINNAAMLDNLVTSGQINAEDLPEDLAGLSNEDMQALLDKSVLPILAESGALSDLVESGKLSADDIPESFTDLDADQVKDLALKVRAAGGERALLDAMPTDERTAFQENILDTYIEMANADQNAAFILDLMPTELDLGAAKSQAADGLGDLLLKGQEPNDFRVGERTGLVRGGSVGLARDLEETAGVENTYGLVVPYSNTGENIALREGHPMDAVEHVSRYLSKIDSDTTTALTGYSQGGQGVLDYVRNRGDADGLDYALAMAPMGGADKDGTGGTGLYAGDFNGVQTLSIEHAQDPAQFIHGDNLAELIPGILNFTNGNSTLGGDGDFHGGYLEDMPREGTYGYPTEYGDAITRDLLNGVYQGHDYDRRGDWAFDLREELLHTGETEEQNIYAHDPWEIASRYRPGR